MGIFTPIFELFFPARCIFCRNLLDNEGKWDICGSCAENTLNPDFCCGWCGHPYSNADGICTICPDKQFSFKGACAVNLYQGQLKRIIHKYKYGQGKYLAGTLGKLMAEQVRRCPWPEFCAVVPIPLHPHRLVERGYDQALLLAQVIGDELSLPVRRVLLRTRPTPSQTKLNAKERWRNVSDAFAVQPELSLAGAVLLVDDILTTGATAHYAAGALLNSGAGEVYVTVMGR